MGQLVEGRWVEGAADVGKGDDGRFERQQSQFRQWIRADGSTPFTPERGRYHLYLAHACPWCHRTAITLAYLGLEDVISTSFVHPLMLQGGWRFDARYPDPIYGYAFVHQLYTRAVEDYTGRVTVPLLWDRHLGRPVSNESEEIVRMIDATFAAGELYPEPLRAAIDEVNARVYDTVNNGVYKCGFAGTQAAYDEAFDALFASLDWLEDRLRGHDWLVGDQLTEADLRLFVTTVRFDAVYHTHFKCNRNRISDMPALQAHLERVLALPGVRGTVDMARIKQHYYGSHRSLNPRGLIPRGPELSWI